MKTVRKFNPSRGKLPPAGRFYIDPVGRVMVFFNGQAVERYGIGTEFRSANLSHILNHEDNTARILLELVEGASGQVMLSYHSPTRVAKAHLTRFLRDMEIAFTQGVKYPVWGSGNQLYLELTSLAKSA